AVEQTELIRGGRLKALAVLSDQPLVLEGVDPIPPITNWLPDMELAPYYFGIFLPVGVPEEVVATLDRIWGEEIANSEAIKTYAETFGAVFAPSYGAEALALAMPVVILEACDAVERGEAVGRRGSRRRGGTRQGGQRSLHDRHRLRAPQRSRRAVRSRGQEPGFRLLPTLPLAGG